MEKQIRVQQLILAIRCNILSLSRMNSAVIRQAVNAFFSTVDFFTKQFSKVATAAGDYWKTRSSLLPNYAKRGKKNIWKSQIEQKEKTVLAL